MEMNGQSYDLKNKLKSIEGQWSVDENGYISYTKIYELPELSKDELFLRAQSFFTYYYNNGESVIQVLDKESGRILGKGIYDDIYSGIQLMFAQSWRTWHIMSVDLKEGRVRLILSLTDYNIHMTGDGVNKLYDTPISKWFPAEPLGNQKNNYGNAFYNSHVRAMETMAAFDKVITTGPLAAPKDW